MSLYYFGYLAKISLVSNSTKLLEIEFILNWVNLIAGKDVRVIHIGEGYRANKIDTSKIYNIKPSDKETSIWDKFKYTNITYAADGMLTYHINEHTRSDIPHEYYHPGFVNTKQVKEAPTFIKILGKLFTSLLEPE